VNLIKRVIHTKRFKLLIATILLYALMTVLFTWPILPNFATQVTDDGDPFFVSWVLQHEKHILQTGDFGNFWHANIFHPYQNTLAYSDHSLTLFLQALPIVMATDNQIVWISYLQLSSFFLAALFAFGLAHYYTRHYLASLAAGIVYGFGAYHVGQISHLQIANYQYLPLLILGWELLLAKPRWRYALFFSIAFLLNAFVSIYLLAFSIIPLFVIGITRLHERRFKLNKLFITRVGGGILLSSVILLPTLLPYLQVSRELGITRSLDEIAYQSANISDYFTAPVNNLLLGNFTQQQIAQTPDKIWNEHMLFMGFVSYTALLGSLYVMWKSRKQAKPKTLIIYSVIAVISGLITLGPYLFNNPVARFNPPLPYYFLYHLLIIFQAIRVPTRIAIVLLLASAILIAKLIQLNDSKKLTRNFIIFICLITVIALEQLSIPIKLITPRSINTALYQWTHQNLADAVVMHYPFSHTIDYLRGSSFDPRRMLNGYSGIVPPQLATMYAKFDASPEESISDLKALGVQYLILHTDFIEIPAGRLKLLPLQKSSELIHIQTIGPDIIYQLR
jgi:hypothetical protein